MANDYDLVDDGAEAHRLRIKPVAVMSVVVALIGCGRVGFSPSGNDGREIGPSDGDSGTAGSAVDLRISAAADDAEEVTTTGTVTVTDVELQLGQLNTLGLRFEGLPVASGATVVSAFVEVTANRNAAGATTVTLVAEAADTAPSFQAQSNNISARSPTSNSVGPWDWPNWFAGNTFDTPDIALVIQDVISRPGWATGNSIVFRISAATGNALVVSFEGDPMRAALLHLQIAP